MHSYDTFGYTAAKIKEKTKKKFGSSNFFS
jgi:hypothetical protein